MPGLCPCVGLCVGEWWWPLAAHRCQLLQTPGLTGRQTCLLSVAQTRVSSPLGASGFHWSLPGCIDQAHRALPPDRGWWRSEHCRSVAEKASWTNPGYPPNATPASRWRSSSRNTLIFTRFAFQGKSEPLIISPATLNPALTSQQP